MLDSKGIEILEKMHDLIIDIPIIILTGVYNELTAIDSLRKYVHDYLIKGKMNSELLVRSIRHSIELHKMLTALRSLSIIDELTGLYNRRGFFVLLENHLNLAKRKKMGISIFYINVNNIENISDKYGSKESDKALIDSSDILIQSFRESDVIARVGSHEFAALAVEASENGCDPIDKRLKMNLDKFVKKEIRPFKLSLNFRKMYCNPDEYLSIEKTLFEADEMMYMIKRSKKA